MLDGLVTWARLGLSVAGSLDGVDSPEGLAGIWPLEEEEEEEEEDATSTSRE